MASLEMASLTFAIFSQQCPIGFIPHMQLGAVGGVGGVQPTTCTSFVPTAPGGCPFITSVGGSTSLPSQVAASLSGGGL
ncbi:hypothetical protein C8R44DRAFT_889272 [Mycena epipterygia]|nr:hypothetical protein C8R44DRAFT_889272 [Mycena epipterygia]